MKALLKSLCLFLVIITVASCPVRALYWEDDFPANDADNAYKMPKGCLFGPLWGKMKRGAITASNFLIYGGKEPKDMGPAINKRKKGMVILGCTTLGVIGGLIVGLSTEGDSEDVMVHRATSVGVGFICGIVLGVWVVPESFSYDEHAAVPGRPAWIEARSIRAGLWQAEF